MDLFETIVAYAIMQPWLAWNYEPMSYFRPQTRMGLAVVEPQGLWASHGKRLAARN